MDWSKALSTLTSPAKIVYVGFLVLIYLDILKDVNWCNFILFSLIFFVLQVFHDDYLRIILNGKAEAIKKSYETGNNK